jgi:hypothetical protein
MAPGCARGRMRVAELALTMDAIARMLARHRNLAAGADLKADGWDFMKAPSRWHRPVAVRGCLGEIERDEVQTIPWTAVRARVVVDESLRSERASVDGMNPISSAIEVAPCTSSPLRASFAE